MTLRYQKADSRFTTSSFNHAALADGREHHIMLHASGLQRGPPRLNVYVDCRLAHTLNDLPAAFGSLPPGPNKVALRTLQSSRQVDQNDISHNKSDPLITLCSHTFSVLVFKDELTDLKMVIEDTIDNVATLQDCSVEPVESLNLLGQ